jgi:hypothetical protein
MDLIIPEFVAFKAHLEATKDLAMFVSSKLEEAMGDKASEWKIENRSITLEKDASISFWNKSWLKAGANDDDLPPLMFQIVPCKPCFDDLAISLRQNEPFAPKFEHRIGMACGACEYAFGKAHDPQNLIGIWSTSFSVLGKTGGSTFEKPLLSGEDRERFGKYVVDIAVSVLKMEHLITPLCEKHNFQNHFSNKLSILFGDLTKALLSVLQKEEEWIMWSSSNLLEPFSSINFYKQSWQRPGQKSPAISISVEAESVKFDNLIYGIRGTIDSDQFTPEQRDSLRKINDILGFGRKSKWWLWYNYAEAPFRKTGGAEQKVIDEKSQLEMQTYFKEKIRSMKEKVAPLIDELFTEPSANTGKQTNSEGAPA